MRAAIYTRISSDPSGEGLGVARQLEDCEQLADRLQWEVVKRYSDNDVSAFSGRVRPQYEAMLKDIADGRVDAVVAWHTDRLHRSPVELETFIPIIDTHGVEIRTVSGGMLDLSTSAGRMVARIVGSVARQESEHTSERRRRSNDQKAALGVWQTARRPFGYSPDGEPLEPEASAVRSAVADVLAGKSLRQVAREWNAQGLRTSRDGKEWVSTSVRRVLKNPRYAALRVHRGAVVGAGEWTPLIDVDAHRGILAYLSDPGRAGKVSFERKWQGSGVYTCGVCGGRLVVHVDAKQRRAYKCSSNHVRRQGEALDAYVDGLVIGRLSRPDARLMIETPEFDSVSLQVERDVLRARSNDAALKFARGVLDSENFEIVSNELRSLLDDVDGKLGAARMGSPLADLILSETDIEERWSELSADLRGKVIDALMVVTVELSPKGLRKFDPEYVRIDWRS
ncbi:recombinase family protein [Rhodococcoides fascians]|uniref:recombinase family protein n=1 Tax=Rhodococcoides fascians TaxID=1828 RepID=UPI00050C1963|nr:recombinase family protein [Rhodococcus fascians]